MNRILAAVLACAVGFAPLPFRTQGAGPTVVTLIGSIDFRSPSHGWIAMSSSAGYSDFCYTAVPEPPPCYRAATSIYATTDGGHTWRRILRFTGKPLDIGWDALPSVWMHLFDAQHAMIISMITQGRSGLYRTMNGGGTWAAPPLPRRLGDIGKTDVAFASQHDLWLLGHAGAAAGSEAVNVYRSRDAGSHWTKIACAGSPAPAPGYGCRLDSMIGFGGHKDNIVFSSRSTGFLVNNNASGIPFLYVTHDGGVRWQSRYPGLPHGVPAPNSRRRVFPYAEFRQPVFFGRLGILPTTVSVCRARTFNENADYVCRSMFYALLSTDGGRTWPVTRRFPVAAKEGLPMWQARNATAWCVAAGNRLWFTKDAGVRWTSVNTSVPRGYRVVDTQFVTQNTGWLIVAKIYQPDGVAQATRLLRTNDGGRHWFSTQLPSQS